MRIAICFSGHPSCFDYSEQRDSYKRLFPGHEVDVFAFCWTDWLQPGDEEKFTQIYQPKFSMFQSRPMQFFKEWGERIYERRSAGRPNDMMFPMWYCIKMANKLRIEYEELTGVTYDLVCRDRVDVWNPEPWAGAIESVTDDSTVVIPAQNNFDGGYNDVIALGRSAAMNVWCGIYDWFPRAYRLGEPWGIETLLRKYVDKYTQLRVAKVPLDYKVIRPRDRGKTYDQLTFNNPDHGRVRV